ncbi:C-C motif chemokine 22-like [Bombina bombina]|uniref:C-C motif chemokine 22-like n=1 Tax=Bombina bombina TaxID=8345 RepID=UPI00235AA9BA|nr:C-C motif chemokine 22-like [Bombina bombina]
MWKLSVLLILVAVEVTWAGPGALDKMDTCCFSFAANPVNHKKIQSFYRTPSSCRRPGVVFKTLANFSFCMDPSKKNTKRVIQILQHRQKAAEMLKRL